MFLIKPFKGLRPKPEFVSKTAAPPYDVLTSQQARDLAQGNPYSFLHISKPEIDLPVDTDPHDESVYQTGKANLERFIKDTILIQDDTPSYYIYRMKAGSKVQTGIVAATSIEAYKNNIIKRHELTQPVKEDDRVRLIETTQAQFSPVMLTYQRNDEIQTLLNKVADTVSPDYDVKDLQGVDHQIWKVADSDTTKALTDLFNNGCTLYMADGHHRSGAASRVKGCDSFLSVIFPDDEVTILPYNRVVTDLNELSQDAFLQQLKEEFTVAPTSAPFTPANPGEFGMYLPGQWYQLTLLNPPSQTDTKSNLEVTQLSEKLIEPVLGITDQSKDKRIDFVGGIHGTEGLQARVDSGEMAVAFNLYHTTMEQLFAISDENEIMPTKSTWFEPKLLDGLISFTLGQT